MTSFDDEDAYGPEDNLGLGRPRPEDAALLTARQLVAACEAARTPEDLAHAAEETEEFISSFGRSVDDSVLLELLSLPCEGATMQALIDLADALAQLAPAIVPKVFRLASGGSSAARANAEIVLGRLRPPDFAAGLLLVLQDGRASDKLKRGAALSLLRLTRSATVVVLDALAEPQIRLWLVRAGGYSPALSDTELMRRFYDDAE